MEIDGYKLSDEIQTIGDYTFRDVLRYPNGAPGISGFQIFKKHKLVGQAWDLSTSSKVNLVVLSQNIGSFSDRELAKSKALEVCE